MKDTKASGKKTQMRHILIMGSGAVGGYYGAKLARSSGFKITFVGRGAHLEAMQHHGLRITGKEEMTLKSLNAVDDPSRIDEKPDLVLITVKSFDTQEAISQLRPVVERDTQILTIQNGLENYELLVDAFGRNNVIRGFCRIGVELTSPGVIDYRGLSVVVFGEENGSSSNRVMQLQKNMEYAGISTKVSPDIRKEAWLKFMWNGIFNMLTGLANVTTDHIFNDDDAYTTAWQLFYEMQTVAGAQGIRITIEEGSAIIDKTQKLGAFRTSTYQDRRKQKPMEFDVFCGYVVRKADVFDLDVPVNRTLFALYKLMMNS